MQSINNTIEYSFPVIDSISQHTKHLKYKPMVFVARNTWRPYNKNDFLDCKKNTFLYVKARGTKGNPPKKFAESLFTQDPFGALTCKLEFN